MHLHTIVKVHADKEEEAIHAVANLLEQGFTGEGGANPFDWYADDETKISDECKTEEDFQALIAQELKEHETYMAEYQKLKDTLDTMGMRGYYLRKAGEALSPTMFWSTERFAYHADWTEGKNTYYIETDRHF